MKTYKDDRAFAAFDAHLRQMGLTKREYFTGLALQAILSNPSLEYNISTACTDAVTAANELIKQLNEESE